MKQKSDVVRGSRFAVRENLTTQPTDYGVINGASGGRALPGGPRSVAADKTPGGPRSVAAEELDAKIADFLAGRYGNLTTEEIAEFRAAQEDPDGTKWEKEHAGEVFGMDALDLNGFLFVEFPAEMPLGKCLEILRRIFRGRTITPDRLWWVTKHRLWDNVMKRQECRFSEELPIGEAALSQLLPSEKEARHE